ncbi:MAG TPA: hypothetical protein VEA41_09890 [Salinarimonas sp.]|nr:hypothetical protein [Salinarimonas sp.]
MAERRDTEKHPVPMAEVEGMIAEAFQGWAGAPVERGSAFIYVGKPKGIRVAIARTKTVSRCFLYFLDDVPESDGLRRVSDEDRRNLRMGNIRYEVDFNISPVASRAAIRACLYAARRALDAKGWRPGEAPAPEPAAPSPAEALGMHQ